MKPESRSLSTIASDILKDWKKPYFGAKPYIAAMSKMDSINEMYGYDPASDIVRYFLANANTWRGPVAQAIKAELKTLLKSL